MWLSFGFKIHFYFYHALRISGPKSYIELLATDTRVSSIFDGHTASSIDLPNPPGGQKVNVDLLEAVGANLKEFLVTLVSLSE